MDSIAHKESSEKKQGAGNGCRLFGIQLLENSNVEESMLPVTLSGRVGDDRSGRYVEAESDQHSEPSNVNRADVPSVSCDAEKSCLQSPPEALSRQIRSCTKVLILNYFGLHNLLLFSFSFHTFCILFPIFYMDANVLIISARHYSIYFKSLCHFWK